MKDFEEKEELEQEEFESGGATTPINRVAKVFRIIFYVAVYVIIAFLILRACTDGNAPKEIDRLIVTEDLAAIYQKDGKLDCFYQKYDEYTMGKENYGYFGITETVIIPDAKQLQIVFRYNNSTLEKLPEDYPELCPEIPNRDELLYDLSLVKVIDTTPETEEDNDEEGVLTKERYFPTKELTVSGNTSLHNYFRYVFENIDISDALEVYVDIYYIKDLNYEEAPYGFVRIYASDRYTHTYSLPAADKKALKDFGKE